MSVYLSFRLYISGAACRCIFVTLWVPLSPPVCMSSFSSEFLCLRLSLYLCLRPSLYLSLFMSPSICVSSFVCVVFFSVYSLSGYLCLRPSVFFLSSPVCIFVSVCLCILVSVCLCILVSLCIFVSVCLCILISVCLCILVSLRRYFSPSAHRRYFKLRKQHDVLQSTISSLLGLHKHASVTCTTVPFFCFLLLLWSSNWSCRRRPWHTFLLNCCCCHCLRFYVTGQTET